MEYSSIELERYIKIVIFSFGFFTNSSLEAALVYVGHSKAEKSIRMAIQNAKPYDTILVERGIYKEGNIVVDKPLFIKGINLPILDGDKRFEVLSIKASHVTVDGFRVQHSSYAVLDDPGGIKIYDSKYVVISNNELFDNFFGIYLQFSSHCKILNNKIISFGKQEQEIGNGIHCWKSDSLVISGNNIKGHRDGIYFEFVTQSVIWRNVARYNIRYGLHFMFSHGDAYFSNYFHHNGAGVAVMFTKNVVMMNNTFEANWGDASYGILLKEINDCYMQGNRFIRNTTGVFMDGTNRCTLLENNLEENGWGMKIQANCMENLIEKNDYLGNTFDVTTNGSLQLNTFKFNYWENYEGYDLNKDHVGDVPYHPLSLFSVIVEQNPSAMLFFRSFLVTLLDRSEKWIPTLTPENFVDNTPSMNRNIIW